MATLQMPASPDVKNAEPSGLPQRIWTSLHESIGEIVFGMEDGTVSIFGVVFGVAASAPDATTVLLAGATGAAAAAVSMMAGTFLDVESARDQARAQLVETRRRIAHDPVSEAQSEAERLRAMGFSDADAGANRADARRLGQLRVGTLCRISVTRPPGIRW